MLGAECGIDLIVWHRSHRVEPPRQADPDCTIATISTYLSVALTVVALSKVHVVLFRRLIRCAPSRIRGVTLVAALAFSGR